MPKGVELKLPKEIGSDLRSEAGSKLIEAAEGLRSHANLKRTPPPSENANRWLGVWNFLHYPEVNDVLNCEGAQLLRSPPSGGVRGFRLRP